MAKRGLKLAGALAVVCCALTAIPADAYVWQGRRESVNVIDCRTPTLMCILTGQWFWQPEPDNIYYHH